MRFRLSRSNTVAAALAVVSLALAPLHGCAGGGGGGAGRRLSLAVNSGVEGDALKAAARDYEAQTGVRVRIAEFPYANLFEKELVDLQAATGAYDLIMLDDPWFPRFATRDFLTDLAPLFARKNLPGPDADFVPTSLALCREPYETGTLYALPYVGNSQLFFYRKDLFEKHGLKAPATWDEVRAAAQAIQEREAAGAPGGAYLPSSSMNFSAATPSALLTVGRPPASNISAPKAQKIGMKSATTALPCAARIT